MDQRNSDVFHAINTDHLALNIAKKIIPPHITKTSRMLALAINRGSGRRDNSSLMRSGIAMVFHGGGPGRRRQEGSRLGRASRQIIQSRLPAHTVTQFQPPLVCGHAADPKARRWIDEPDAAIRRWLANEIDGVVVTVMTLWLRPLLARQIDRMWHDLHETITRNHQCRTLSELLRRVFYLRIHAPPGDGHGLMQLGWN